MYITYNQLLALQTMKDVTVVAGADGLYRGIQWTQVLEFDEIEEWVGQGSLIWVTGVAVRTWKLSIEEVIEQAIRAQASGMVIYLGAYIKVLSQRVYDICNENDFPLLVAPIEVKFVEVSCQIAELIFANQKRQDKVNNIINDVFMNTMAENAFYLMDSINFCGTFYRCVIIRGEEEKNYAKWNNVQNVVINYFEKYNYSVITRIGENGISMILATEIVPEDEEVIIKNLIHKVAAISSIGELCEVIGDVVLEPKMIGLSMKQALYTYEIVKHRVSTVGVYWYRNLGVYRLLCAESIETEKESFRDDYLGELLLPKNKELLDTLIVYIRNGQNLKQAADTLFIHQNTMKYRIKKIEQILNRNLKDVDVANCLYIALAICETEGIL